MLKSLFLLLATTLAAFPAATSAATPPPDIVPRGYHGVAVERRAELGSLLELCCVQHRIAAGDTISRLAASLLGSAARAEEVLALNPGIDPRRLKIGQRIWMPPRRADAPKPRRFVYLWAQPDQPGPLAANDEVYARYGSFRLVLVPERLREAFDAARKEGWNDVEKLVKKHEIECVAGNSGGSLVRDGSPVVRMEEVIRVTRTEAGAFTCATEVKRFDKDGKLVTPEKENEKKGEEEGKGKQAWLLLLAVGGGGLALLRARRNPAALLSGA